MSDRGRMLPWLERLLARGSFRVEFGNDTRAPARWGLAERVIPRFHMVTVKKGRLRYSIEDRWETVEPGVIAFVSPGICHSGEPDRGRWPHLLTCRFDYLRDADGRAAGRLAEPFSAIIRVRDAQKYVGLFESLYRHFIAPGSVVRRRACDAIVTRIVCELAFDHDEPHRRTDHRIEKVMAFMRGRPERRVTVAELAGRAGMSSKTFFQHFRRIAGCPPLEFQIRARCERARELLLTSTLSVKEIAHHLGYRDQYTFSKQFKAAMGVAPVHYRSAPGRTADDAF